jgi:hypothetical protein
MPIKQISVKQHDTEIEEAITTMFLEELSWVFQSHPQLSARSLAKALAAASRRRTQTQDAQSFVSPNPNIQFLVGTLPLVLRDESLFPTNGSIADFAKLALKLPLQRWEKKSRFELIGEIVCNTIDLNDHALSKLVDALSVLARGDSSTKAMVVDAQNSQRNWNEIIQILLKK